MLQTKSEKVRSFFDLVGALSCGLIFGSWLHQDAALRIENFSTSAALILYALASSSCYLLFHFLVWRFISVRFLRGYLNFVFISFGGFTSFLFSILLAKVWIDDFPIYHFFLYQGFFNVLFYLNLFALMPMIFFSVIGVIVPLFLHKKMLP